MTLARLVHSRLATMLFQTHTTYIHFARPGNLAGRAAVPVPELHVLFPDSRIVCFPPWTYKCHDRTSLHRFRGWSSWCRNVMLAPFWGLYA